MVNSKTKFKNKTKPARKSRRKNRQILIRVYSR